MHQKFLSLIVVIGGSLLLAAAVGVAAWLCVRNYRLYGWKSMEFIVPLAGGSVAALGVAALLIFGVPWIRQSGTMYDLERRFIDRVNRMKIEESGSTLPIDASAPLRRQAAQLTAATKSAEAKRSARLEKTEAAEAFMQELSVCKRVNPSLTSLCSGADSACERLMVALGGDEGLKQYQTMRRLSKSPYEVTNLCSRAAQSVLAIKM